MADPRERRLHLDALGAAAAGPPAGSRQALEELRGLMLGFDVEAAGLREALSRPLEGSAGEAFARGAAGVLDIFVDVCSLFRRQGEDEEEWEDGNGFGAEEYLFTYLRKLDEKGAGLPAAFLAKLQRALRHYGVCDLSRSPELEESLYRVCKAHQREEQLAAPVSLLLERFLDGEAASLAAVPDLPALLDRLIAATQSRYPAVNDLAREVRFRLVERPLLERVRGEAFAAAERDLAALATGPGGDARAAHVESLVQCPQPLAGLLVERYGAAARPVREAILEVLLRRFYRIRALDEIRVETRGGPSLRGRQLRARGAEPARPPHARRRRGPRHGASRAWAASRPPPRPGGSPWATCSSGGRRARATPRPTPREMRAVLAGVALPRPFRRIVLAVGRAGRHAALHVPPGPGRRATRRRPSSATRTR